MTAQNDQALGRIARARVTTKRSVRIGRPARMCSMASMDSDHRLAAGEQDNADHRQIAGASVESNALPNVRGTAALTKALPGPTCKPFVVALGAQLYQDGTLSPGSGRVHRRRSQLSEWEAKRLYDPASGALAVRGKDTLRLPDTVSKDYQTTVDGIRKGLSNERQQVQFDRTVEARRKDINTTLSRHVFTEMRKYEDSETENYIKIEQQAGILGSDDPARVQLSIDRQKRGRTSRAATATGRGKDGGMSQYLKQKLLQIDSDTTVGVIERFLAQGNDRMAQQISPRPNRRT